MTPSGSIAAIVPSFNGGEVIAECLTSLRADPLITDIVVVDNASSDSTLAVCDRHAVRVVARRTNGGFGTACNEGVAATDSDYVLLINQDAALSSSIDEAKRVLDTDPNVGVVGARMVSKSGEPRPTVMKFPSLSGIALKRFSYDRPLNAILESAAAGSTPLTVDYFEFSFALIRRSAFVAVGGFDEAYFMYGEERDLVFRMRAAGYPAKVVGSVTYTHDGGYSPARYGMIVDGQRRFIRDHVGFPKSVLYQGVLSAKPILRRLRGRAPRGPDSAKSKNRILLLHSSAELYGSDRSLLALAENLVDLGESVTVALPEAGPLTALLRERGIAVIETAAVIKVSREMLGDPFGVVAGIFGALRGLPKLWRTVRTANVVHSNTTAVLAGALFSKLPGIGHVWTVREIVGRPLLIARLLAKIVLHASDVVAFNSDATADHWYQVEPRLRRQGTVVSNQVDRPSHVHDAQDGRRHLSLNPSDKVVSLVGRVNAWKGHGLLLDAFRAAALPPEWVLVFAGDAPAGEQWREESLRNAAADLGDRVRFLGFQADPGLIYAASDIVVVPSTRPEPFGRVAIEAAHYGVCVVAADHGGLAGIVKNEETGLHFRANDVRSLVDRLRRLAGDSHLRAKLGTQAQIVAKSHSTTAVATRYGEIYAKLRAG